MQKKLSIGQYLNAKKAVYWQAGLVLGAGFPFNQEEFCMVEASGRLTRHFRCYLSQYFGQL